MKTIGLLGGMSWESTQIYYRLLNEGVRRRLGGLHSARVAIISVEFAEIEGFQRDGRWDLAATTLVDAAQQLERAGADFLVICSNTMHKVAPEIERAVDLPLLHIADVTADRIGDQGLRAVGLLGTRSTMEEVFYIDRLRGRHRLEVLVPPLDDRRLVDRVIFEELCVGTLREESRAEYRRVMRDLVERGAEGIIAGCTEIGALVTAEDAGVALFDTTRIHADAAVARALS
ncbi:MAG: aspartate/glutamate racemase family protein [Candidatus Bipolaricaulota bacterium]|nr:MAG: aspartate/glutamate racemase family protein [Candidatus Bipolaricaulota bacterium]